MTPGSQIVRIIEQTADIGCSFDFTWIPWDWQECELTYFDNRYGSRMVNYEKGVFKIHDDVTLAEWEIIDEKYEEDETEGDAGPPASAVKATIILERQISFYIRFIFIPSIFLVLISYTSFFVDHKCIPGRVALGIIPVLTAFA